MRHELRTITADEYDEIERRVITLIADDPTIEYAPPADPRDGSPFTLDGRYPVAPESACTHCGAILLSDCGGDFLAWVDLREGGDFYNCDTT